MSKCDYDFAYFILYFSDSCRFCANALTWLWPPTPSVICDFTIYAVKSTRPFQTGWRLISREGWDCFSATPFAWAPIVMSSAVALGPIAAARPCRCWPITAQLQTTRTKLLLNLPFGRSISPRPRVWPYKSTVSTVKSLGLFYSNFSKLFWPTGYCSL